MTSEAQLIQDEAQYLLDNPLLDRDEIDRTLIRIRNRAAVYISAEQREDDNLLAKVFNNGKDVFEGFPSLTDPGLSGQEMAAFHKMKTEETVGEDPEFPITHDLH